MPPDRDLPRATYICEAISRHGVTCSMATTPPTAGNVAEDLLLAAKSRGKD